MPSVPTLAATASGTASMGSVSASANSRFRPPTPGPFTVTVVSPEDKTQTAPPDSRARATAVASQRGAEGGYRLAKPPAEVSLAEVIRAVEGPIATVRGARPEDVEYTGAASGLRDVWIELRASMRGVLEETSLAELVRRSLR